MPLHKLQTIKLTAESEIPSTSKSIPAGASMIVGGRRRAVQPRRRRGVKAAYDCVNENRVNLVGVLERASSSGVCGRGYPFRIGESPCRVGLRGIFVRKVIF
jgi:hypothetical protein